MKFKKLSPLLVAIIFGVVIVSASVGGYALAPYVWSGNVSVPKPTVATDSFTVVANVNGTVAADPSNIVSSDFPSVFFQGDSVAIVYTITSTANANIIVTPTATSNAYSMTWSVPNVTILPGGTGFLILTIPNVTSAGTIAVSFSGFRS